MKDIERPPLYANAVNLAGLYASLPLQVNYDPETGTYWDRGGDFDVTKIGTTHERGRIVFASDKNSEAVAWTLGVKATMSMLREWSKSG